MYKFRSRYRATRVLAAASIAVSLCAGCSTAPKPAYTQTAQPHLNFVQRHPTMTSVGAGIATHHVLKVMAARDKAQGKSLNWAERHPTLSAVGVGVITHHEIKAHTPHP